MYGSGCLTTLKLNWLPFVNWRICMAMCLMRVVGLQTKRFKVLFVFLSLICFIFLVAHSSIAVCPNFLVLLYKLYIAFRWLNWNNDVAKIVTFYIFVLFACALINWMYVVYTTKRNCSMTNEQLHSFFGSISTASIIWLANINTKCNQSDVNANYVYFLSFFFPCLGCGFPVFNHK